MTVAFVFIGHLSIGRTWVSRRESGPIQGFSEKIKKEMPLGRVAKMKFGKWCQINGWMMS